MPGWAVVRWDTGGAEPLHVNDLQLEDDTQDFLRRVYSHNVRTKTDKDSLRGRAEALKNVKLIRWKYVVIRGINRENGSFIVWDPTSEVQPEFNMPVRVLKSCAESGGRIPAALLVRRIDRSNSARYEAGGCISSLGPVKGELQVGDLVVVDATALADAGLRVDQLTVPAWPHRHSCRKLVSVPARVVGLTGRKDIGVMIAGYEANVYWVHGTRVMGSDPRDGKRCPEGIEDPPLCYRHARTADCSRRGGRARPASAAGRLR